MTVLKSVGALVLASSLAAPAAIAGHHGKMAKGNIVETAAAAGQFETLIAAAKAAGLAGALTGDGPLTVFAPTDDAFGALPAGTIETLLKPENKDQLARILKYHVIAGRVGSGALADGAALDTLAGVAATVQATEQGFAIQGARIIATDIDASNGVVHVIDRVILPPEQMAAVSPVRIIDMAIERGVPMFNHGNPAATTAIYTVAAQSLVTLAGDALTSGQVQRLQRGLREANHSGSQRDAAWALRYALDDVRMALAEGQPINDNRRMTAR